MLKKFLLFLILFNIYTHSIVASMTDTPVAPIEDSYEDPTNVDENYIKNLYEELNLGTKLDFSIFKRGFEGYLATPDRKKGNFIIIDYTKPSNEKRFFVVDLKTKTLKYETLVSHGKNSGLIVPVNFSNTRNSFQTSLGFYKTGETYSGSYGYSLKLVGLEEGFNSNALERKIVIHGSNEITQKYIDQTGFLGRSDGCPALPNSIAKEVIDFIKEGSVIYVIGNDSKYIQNSKYGINQY
ncbi:murein L,D-transpeptidase catalytic domain family protein [Fusobacterium sp. PH5-44]|uniref:murein L,D-transpeptidase catalytic domain family protein n=1 Tax=unclassified Fusobacterium TaxID=2648384 RepID=UPI003D21EAE7